MSVVSGKRRPGPSEPWFRVKSLGNSDILPAAPQHCQQEFHLLPPPRTLLTGFHLGKVYIFLVSCQLDEMRASPIAPLPQVPQPLPWVLPASLSSHYQILSFGLEAPVKIQSSANELKVIYQIKVTTAYISWQKWEKEAHC